MSYEAIDLSAIKADAEFNVRKDVGDIDGLTESIKSLGVQQPIGVHKKKSGVYSLVYGFRRVAAATEAGLNQIPARIYPTKTKKSELLLLNLQENVTRDSLNPMEEADGIQRLIDEGMDRNEVADALGYSQTLITQRLQLLDYSDPIQQALTADKISVMQARACATLPEDRHERFVDIAADLPIAKFREMVDSELERIERMANPEPPEPVEMDDEDDEDIEDDNVDPTLLVTGIVSLLCDLASHSFDDESQQARAIVVFKSIEWSALPFDDLESLNGTLSDIADAGGFEGASDFSE